MSYDYPASTWREFGVISCGSERANGSSSMAVLREGALLRFLILTFFPSSEICSVISSYLRSGG